eukprot:NODE_26914_length_533_cov_0.751232.p4 GENE.NODE_26914_length_533_cov_0.751232~~NODE_26914_length_533_cov_0.751232.p4  ORF type:complete len:63 (-),score=4.11 NODE_26914_length_533_cov_0.751232:145-333(-)
MALDALCREFLDFCKASEVLSDDCAARCVPLAVVLRTYLRDEADDLLCGGEYENSAKALLRA